MSAKERYASRAGNNAANEALDHAKDHIDRILERRNLLASGEDANIFGHIVIVLNGELEPSKKPGFSVSASVECDEGLMMELVAFLEERYRGAFHKAVQHLYLQRKAEDFFQKMPHAGEG